MSCHKTITDVFTTIKRFFDKTMPDFIDAHVVPILNFVEGLKIIEENITPVIEQIFPSVPASLFVQIDLYLSEICTALQIEIACKGETGTFEERLQCIAAHLASVDPEMRAALEIKLASYLTRKTSGVTNISADQIDTIVQFCYSHYKHLNTTDTGTDE